MANFGSASKRVYFKLQIVFLQMCRPVASPSVIRSFKALSRSSNGHIYKLERQMFPKSIDAAGKETSVFVSEAVTADANILPSV